MTILERERNRTSPAMHPKKMETANDARMTTSP